MSKDSEKNYEKLEQYNFFTTGYCCFLKCSKEYQKVFLCLEKKKKKKKTFVKADMPQINSSSKTPFLTPLWAARVPVSRHAFTSWDRQVAFTCQGGSLDSGDIKIRPMEKRRTQNGILNEELSQSRKEKKLRLVTWRKKFPGFGNAAVSGHEVARDRRALGYRLLARDALAPGVTARHWGNQQHLWFICVGSLR